MENIIVWISLGGSIALMIYAIVKIVKAVQIRRYEKEAWIREQERMKVARECERMKKALEQEEALGKLIRMKKYMLLNELNMDYLLGLDDYEIALLSEEEDFDKMMKKMAAMVDTEPITWEVFANGVLERAYSILQNSGLSYERQAEVMELVEASTLEEDDEILKNVIENSAKGEDCPEQLSFLLGRVNYTLAAVGPLKAIAIVLEDEKLQKHIENLCQKKGYTYMGE